MEMQSRYFIRASVVLLVVIVLMVGVDAQAQIAFVSWKNDNSDIYVMDADGGNPRNLHQIIPPSDGTHVFSSKRGADWNKRNGDWDIYVMDADGGNPRNLTKNCHNDWHPSWSPDGIAFASNRDGNLEIYVMDADGGNPQNLTKNRHSDWQPSWSPDGTHCLHVWLETVKST